MTYVIDYEFPEQQPVLATGILMRRVDGTYILELGVMH